MFDQFYLIHNTWHANKMMWRIIKRGFASRFSTSHFGNPVQISDEVKEAIISGKGVVALESTIITHGMPYPHNFSTALSVERKVRESGSVPATVAVIDGQFKVGLNDTELLFLAEKTSKLIKISRRDLSYVISQKLSGGTTVSGTMIAAHLAGIHVFATGGIGGVHRGAETSFDVSADLTELGRTPVAVVSSGVKSILDIPKTLEYLETQGVFVSSVGESKDFPAFFTPKSGSQAPYNTPTIYEAAQNIDAQLNVGLNSGMLFAVPIPTEFAACGEKIETAVKIAVFEAQKQNIVGKAVTPFILKEVNRITEGESLLANIALIENNAQIAGSIAHCLAQIQRGYTKKEILSDPSVQSISSATSHSDDSQHPSASLQQPDWEATSSTSLTSPKKALRGRPVVIGATVIDLMIHVKDDKFQMDGATYPGKVRQSFGGVGRNLADGLTRMETDPIFVSAVGNDLHSAKLYTSCKHMDLNMVQKLNFGSTASYCPILGSAGQLLFGVGDMDINDVFDVQKVPFLESAIQQAPMVILDGNFTAKVIHDTINISHESKVPVWFEPTDVHKADKPFQTNAWQKITIISPNLAELRLIWKAFLKESEQTQKMKGYTKSEASDSKASLVNECLAMCRDLSTSIPVIVVTMGKLGALLCTSYENTPHVSLRDLKQPPKTPSFRAFYYPAVGNKMQEPVMSNVSGAGDCLNAAAMANLLEGKTFDESLRVGMLAATFSLHSESAVPESMNPSSVCLDVANTFGWTVGQDVTHGFDSIHK